MFFNSISLADIFGYLGTITASSLMLPQVYDSYKRKSMTDVSFMMLIMYQLNAILWIAYASLNHSVPVLIANILAGLVGIVLIAMKVKYTSNNSKIITKKYKKKKK